MRGRLLVCGLLAACGRYGFVEAEPPSTGFLCNEPQRFTTGGSPVGAMAAVPTPTGHALYMADTAGNLSAWSYENAEGALLSTSANIAVDVDITTTIHATALDSLVVVSAIHGLAAPLGTKLYPRDATGASRGPAVEHPELAADVSLATSPSGQLAFATVDATTEAVLVRRIDALGAYRTAPVTVTTEPATYAMLGPAAFGFIAQWNVRLTGADPLMIALLDETFAIVAGPFQANNNGTGQGPGRPRVVWGADSDTYLVTWHEKNGTDEDVWYQLRDGNLEPLTVPAILGPHGVKSEVSTDGTAFWVSWKDLTSGVLFAAQISSTGVVTPRTVTTSGGLPSQWTMLTSGEQPVLVWLETGGSGPDLWIDPLCP